MRNRMRSEKNETYELLSETDAPTFLARQLGRGFTPLEAAELLANGSDDIRPPKPIVNLNPKTWRSDDLEQWARRHGRKLKSQWKPNGAGQA